MTLPELALRFILGNPDVTTVIPGMRRPAHVERNLGVSGARALASGDDGRPPAPSVVADVCREVTSITSLERRWTRGRQIGQGLVY